VRSQKIKAPDKNAMNKGNVSDSHKCFFRKHKGLLLDESLVGKVESKNNYSVIEEYVHRKTVSQKNQSVKEHFR